MLVYERLVCAEHCDFFKFLANSYCKSPVLARLLTTNDEFIGNFIRKNEFLAQSLQHYDVNVFSFISKLKACFKKCECQVTRWIHGYNQIRTIIQQLVPTKDFNWTRGFP